MIVAFRDSSQFRYQSWKCLAMPATWKRSIGLILNYQSMQTESPCHVAPQIQQSESLAWSCCSTDTAVWVPRLVISHQINKSSASQYLPALLCDFFQLSYVSCCIEVEYERIMLQDFSPNKKSLKNFLFFENVFMLKIMEDVILVS